jgi:hypothetical protein
LPFRAFIVSCVTLSLAALILSAAAFYNRYPLLYPDTITYLADGVQLVRRLSLWQPEVGWPANGRSVYYGLAIWPLHLQWSLWPIVFVQALLLSHLMRLTLRCLDIPVGPVGFIIIVAVLTLLTPISWHVSHVMPDVFAGILILAMYLLGYRSDRLRRWETPYLIVLATSAILFHASHLAIGLALLGQGVLTWLLSPKRRKQVRLVLLAIPVGAGLAGLLAYPLIVRHQIALAPNSLPYYLARLWVDGQARSYLQQTCKTTPYALCHRMDDIGTEDTVQFIFGLGADIQAVRAEASRITLGTIRTYPGWVARSAAENFGKQLLTFRLEVGLNEQDRQGLKQMLPADFERFQTSRQRAGELDTTHLYAINVAQYIFIGLSVLAVVPLVFLRRRLSPGLMTALLTIGIALGANAFVAGAISSPVARYQGRVVWLVPFWVSAAGLSFHARRTQKLPRDRNISFEGDHRRQALIAGASAGDALSKA